MAKTVSVLKILTVFSYCEGLKVLLGATSADYLYTNKIFRYLFFLSSFHGKIAIVF